MSRPLSSATVDLVMAGRFQNATKSFGPLQLHNGIYKSCNAYFSNAYLKQLANMLNPLSVDIWSNHVSFGSIIYGL
jgi:penicillin-binding protein 2